MPPLLGRPAGDRALQAGVRVLRARPAPHTGPTIAVPAQRAEPVAARGRRPEDRTQLEARGDGLVRRGVQARVGRVPRLHRHGPPTQNVGPGRAPGCSPLRGRRPRRHGCGCRARAGDGRRTVSAEPAATRQAEQRRDVFRVLVANAPVSYGAFEITVGVDPHVPDPVTLLDWVSAAGYEGLDLGPIGYLGTGEVLAQRLSERRLGLAGGYLGLAFSEPDKMHAGLVELDALLDIFDAAGGVEPPKPTLADAGSAARSRYPGRAALDHSVGLDDAAWKRFGDGLARAVERCRERGYEPTFHHHTATYVEAHWEIERLLEVSDVGLCLDTGHLLLGRGDPVE